MFVSRYQAEYTMNEEALAEYVAEHKTYPPRLLDIPAPLETIADPAIDYDFVIEDIARCTVPPPDIVQPPEFMQRIFDTLVSENALPLRDTRMPNVPFIEADGDLQTVTWLISQTGLKGGRFALENIAKRRAEGEVENTDTMETN
jgi:hypothetical protein